MPTMLELLYPLNDSFSRKYDMYMRRSQIQGPLEGTVNEFWQMVLQEEAETIVMLCNCIETVSRLKGAMPLI
ncbi:unnamed protein product [Cylicostephanus goldi]|uniref:Tyrosine-protein phosphatase domain-containing protein n=1 Tax=Cylicostephanus goldi TaxID=71465 RepID=A0A3P6RS67_CYLGO|nr:unnamed protein product [Cylicostephanus goldi]